jgi:hypothetical protein
MMGAESPIMVADISSCIPSAADANATGEIQRTKIKAIHLTIFI